jgi:hypothetical protein
MGDEIGQKSGGNLETTFIRFPDILQLSIDLIVYFMPPHSTSLN